MQKTFRNKFIHNPSGKDFFLICKMIDGVLSKEDADFIKSFIEKISLSNQHAIELLRKIDQVTGDIMATE